MTCTVHDVCLGDCANRDRPTCSHISRDLTGRCFACGHVDEAIRADQAAADARHREYAKADARTLPPEIEAAIADAGQALVDAWDSAQSGPPHRFAVYTDPEGDPEVAAGWMAMARMHAAAIAAAREAGRREALEGAAGVEEAINEYTTPITEAFEAMPKGCRLPWLCSERKGNAWGKPSLKLICGECEEDMEAEEGGES